MDLGAIRPSRPAAGQDGPPAGGAAPAPAAEQAAGLIVDVTEATFQAEVMERSLQVPVVVDFWADWCQPCKQLSPILEKLVAEGGGRWVLAKVDVDANPRLAEAFRIQSIPTVYAVVGGQPVDGFPGALPEPQVRQWLDAVLAAGGTAPTEPEVDGRILDADEALAAGELDLAEQQFRAVLNERPADPLASSGLAQVALMRRVQTVDSRQALVEAQQKPDDVAAQTAAADVEVMGGRAEEAYQRLVDTVRRVAGSDREAVRKHLLSLFEVAGPDDPAVAAARRALASALF